MYSLRRGLIVNHFLPCRLEHADRLTHISIWKGKSMKSSFRFLLLIISFSLIADQHANGIDLAWKPVSATTSHLINGNEIVVSIGGTTVTLEMRISNWANDLAGNSQLHGYQARLDSSGFTSGPFGSLSIASIPCTDDGDCFGDSTCGTIIPDYCDFFIGSDHSAAHVDSNHPDYVYAGVEVYTGVNAVTDDIMLFSLTQFDADSPVDTGGSYYAGTIKLDVSEDASGTFTIGFLSGPDSTLFISNNSEEFGPIITTSATITIINDCNVNGVPDDEDISSGTSPDCNTNNIPDDCEADCNNNNIADDCDVASSASDDCNHNLVPDECELEDCNQNGTQDICDIVQGISEDCNANDIPDECEWSDCNANNLLDLCDIATGVSNDCNNNTTPDECESVDCNENGVADNCDIDSGFSMDVNSNGVPDGCEPTRMIFQPIHANSNFRIRDNEIFLRPGGALVTLDLQITNWDLDQNGAPLLRAYQAKLDSSGFTSGEAGSLSLATIACASDNDCFGDTTCGMQVSGVCDNIPGQNHAHVFIDENNPKFIYSGIENIFGTNTVTNDVILFGLTSNQDDSVADTGENRYFGTILIDVPPDAFGTFWIGMPDSTDESLLVASSNVELPVRRDVSFITIINDCNENFISDSVDIANGASSDCDSNSIPDECEWVDCNSNNISDLCDITVNFSQDVNTNLIPDECEEDCDGNDIPDTYEVVLGNGSDCNHNLILDSCDIEKTTWLDCNGNGFLDECDIAEGFSPDVDGNCIPDECLQRPRPAAELIPQDKSRYLAFTPTRAGCLSAIRVTLRSLYHPDVTLAEQPDFTAFENEIRWVGPPSTFSENATGDSTFNASQLQCEPFFGDWDSIEIVHVYGDAVLPNSLYEVQMVGSDCVDVNDTSCHSGPLQIYTGQWCDVTAPYYTPFGSSQPDIADVLAVVSKWLGESEPRKALAQLQPNILKPATSVGISDVLVAVDAWLGSPYPYAGPTSCP